MYWHQNYKLPSHGILPPTPGPGALIVHELLVPVYNYWSHPNQDIFGSPLTLGLQDCPRQRGSTLFISSIFLSCDFYPWGQFLVFIFHPQHFYVYVGSFSCYLSSSTCKKRNVGFQILNLTWIDQNCIKYNICTYCYILYC